MAKLLAAFVLSCALLPVEGESMSQPRITLTPLPPTAGQGVTITFSGTNPQTLDIEWVPSGAGPSDVTTDANGNVTITVPGTATSMSVSGGGAVAQSTSITTG